MKYSAAAQDSTQSSELQAALEHKGSQKWWNMVQRAKLQKRESGVELRDFLPLNLTEYIFLHNLVSIVKN